MDFCHLVTMFSLSRYVLDSSRNLPPSLSVSINAYCDPGLQDISMFLLFLMRSFTRLYAKLELAKRAKTKGANIATYFSIIKQRPLVFIVSRQSSGFPTNSNQLDGNNIASAVVDRLGSKIKIH